jgi:hypothetical protein
LKNVKQRDFQSDPLEVKSDNLGRLHIVDKPGEHVRLSSKPAGAQSDADGKEAAAVQVIQDNPRMAVRDIVRKLKEMGIKRGRTWISNKRYDLGLGGTKVTSS